RPGDRAGAGGARRRRAHPAGPAAPAVAAGGAAHLRAGPWRQGEARLDAGAAGRRRAGCGVLRRLPGGRADRQAAAAGARRVGVDERRPGGGRAADPARGLGGAGAGDGGERAAVPHRRLHGLTPLRLAPGMRLADAVQTVSRLPFARTDCALPMLHALDRGLAVDAFVVLTDSETWAGAIHPVQALRQYRERTGIAAKLVVVGMVSNGFSIADPDDAGMLDVVGFDSAAPALIADFIRQ